MHTTLIEHNLEDLSKTNLNKLLLSFPLKYTTSNFVPFHIVQSLVVDNRLRMWFNVDERLDEFQSFVFG